MSTEDECQNSEPVAITSSEFAIACNSLAGCNTENQNSRSCTTSNALNSRSISLSALGTEKFISLHKNLHLPICKHEEYPQGPKTSINDRLNNIMLCVSPPKTKSKSTQEIDKSMSPTRKNKPGRSNLGENDAHWQSTLRNNNSHQPIKDSTSPFLKCLVENIRYMKKAQLVEHLILTSTQLHESEQEKRQLQCEVKKNEAVLEGAINTQQLIKAKYESLWHIYTEHVQQLTTFCLKEQKLQLHGEEVNKDDNIQKLARHQTESDVEAAINCGNAASTVGIEMLKSGTNSLALAYQQVAQDRIATIEKILKDYNQQLTAYEVALSHAKRDNASTLAMNKIQALQDQSSKQELKNVENLAQIDILLRQIKQLRSELDQNNQEVLAKVQQNDALQIIIQKQFSAFEKLIVELKSEWKKRHGVVPSVFDLKWHQYVSNRQVS